MSAAHRELVAYLATGITTTDTLGEVADRILAITDDQSTDDKVRRLCTRIANLTRRDEQAVLAIHRVLMWCEEQDGLSKGESMTTAKIRELIGEEFR